MENFNQQEVSGNDIRRILKNSSFKNKSNDPNIQSLMVSTGEQIDVNKTNSDVDPMETLINVNNSLRANIRLGLAIYKKLNNFDHNYIHELFNEEITKKSE